MVTPNLTRPEVKRARPAPKWIAFDWDYGGRSGQVAAVTFAGAADKARRDYLLKCNIGTSRHDYRQLLELLKERSFKIKFSDLTFERFRHLYREFQYGGLTNEADLAELKQFQSIIRDKEAYNAAHHPQAR